MLGSTVCHSHPTLPLIGRRDIHSGETIFGFPYFKPFVPLRDADTLEAWHRNALAERLKYLANQQGILFEDVDVRVTPEVPEDLLEGVEVTRPVDGMMLITGTTPTQYTVYDRELIDTDQTHHEEVGGDPTLYVDISRSYGRVALLRCGEQIADVYRHVMVPSSEIF